MSYEERIRRAKIMAQASACAIYVSKNAQGWDVSYCERPTTVAIVLPDGRVFVEQKGGGGR